MLQTEEQWKNRALRNKLNADKRIEREVEQEAARLGDQRLDDTRREIIKSLRERNAELEAMVEDATKPWLDRFADWFTKKPPREPDDVEDENDYPF